MSEETRKTLCARLHDDFWVPFQNRTDFVESIKEDRRFYNGSQWPDNNIRNDIRITNNKISDGIRKRASKIASTPIYLSFIASDGKHDCTSLQRYDQFVLAKLGIEAFNLQTIINALNVGTAVTYVRFDGNAEWDYGSFYEGGLEVEDIDILNFAVANPHQPNIQKQEWIMFWDDIYVGQLVKVLKEEKFKDSDYKERLSRLYKEAQARSSLPDDSNPDKAILNNALVRVYTRFFRINGEVCYEYETETVSLLRYPRPLSKSVSESFAKKVKEEFDKRKEKNDAYDPSKDNGERQFRLVEDLDIDLEDTIVNTKDKATGEDGHRKYRERFSLYPFALYAPRVINKFVFGRSMTKEMIPLQKGINTAMSYQLRGMENLVWNKVFIREGAMKNGEFFSSAIEDNVQYDHFRGNGNGFYTITPPSMPAELYKIPEYFASEMKDTHGFTDFANGNVSNPESSGFFAELMIKQANTPIEQEQKLFWEYYVQLARIRLMFYKHYIDERVYSYEYDEVEYATEEESRQAIMGTYYNGGSLQGPNNEAIPFEAIQERYGKETPKTKVDTFKGKELWGLDFDIKVLAQQGLVESEVSEHQWYTTMFGNGGIQAFVENPDALEFVVETAPRGVIPENKRPAVKHYAQRMKNSLINRQRAEIEQLKNLLQQASEMGKAQMEEFQNYIGAANKMVGNARKERDEAIKAQSEAQPSEGEAKSYAAKGVKKDDIPTVGSIL